MVDVQFEDASLSFSPRRMLTQETLPFMEHLLIRTGLVKNSLQANIALIFISIGIIILTIFILVTSFKSKDSGPIIDPTIIQKMNIGRSRNL